MAPDEVAEPFRLAAEETFERIRRDFESLPATFAPLLVCIEKRLFIPGFCAQEARRLGCLGKLEPPLGQPLTAYLDEQRIRTAVAILERAGERIATGRAAREVGITSYRAYRRAYRRWCGESPRLVRSPVRLEHRFDHLSWHRAWCGELTQAGRTLGRRLCRLYPSAFFGGAPGAELLVDGESVVADTYGVSESEAQQALERAAEESLRRLQRDAESLPPDLARVFQGVAERLFDPALSVGAARECAGLRDTGLTTKVRFFTGDTLADVIEKRRIEVAVALLADQRLTIDRISEGVGMSYRRFCRVFKLRTAAQPSHVRKTLRLTSGHAAFRLWHRAESGTLSLTEARQLGGHLRALCPEAFEDIEPASLTVRTDINPQRVAEVIRLSTAVAQEARATLDEVLRTHPDYSAAHWYSHWIHARLGRGTLDSAWASWQAADRDLRALLEVPLEQRADRVRQDPSFHRDAFFWLLVDCAFTRLFHDAAESEHFIDLALAAAKPGRRRYRRLEAVGLYCLALALKGNAIRRRNDLAEAGRSFEQALMTMRSGAIDGWIEGLVHSLHASLLDRQGEYKQARRSLALAAPLLKKSGDQLERLRLVIKRGSVLFAEGRDPSRLLTLCLQKLQKYPFADDLRQATHLTLVLSRLYLADQLSGRYLAEIQTLLASLPSTGSSYFAANRQQIDGLIATLSGKPAAGGRILRQTAQWYEDHHFFGDAAVTWIQYSWAVLEVDSENARRAALIAHEYMVQTGFNGHGQKRIAQQIYSEALRHTLNRETLRFGILLRTCPRIETRLAPWSSRASGS